MKLQAALVQALPPSCSPLAQFPTITPETGLEKQITKGAEGKRWLEKWVKKDTAVEKRVRGVAELWPRLEIVSAEFKGKAFTWSD